MKHQSRIKRTLPTAIDLFAGCGGASQGLRQAGFRVIGAVEVDALAADTYKLNHKSVFLWRKDIRALDGTAIKQQLRIRSGQLDLLAGCPPCQGFSRLRTLNGNLSVNDNRNDLLFEFVRLVRELRPKTLMMENVPGLLNDDR